MIAGSPTEVVDKTVAFFAQRGHSFSNSLQSLKLESDQSSLDGLRTVAE
jgi:hypothetical protein